MNFSGPLLVAARGCSMSVSDRKHGSANGNRTRIQRGSLCSVSYERYMLRLLMNLVENRVSVQNLYTE
jgi:hypothetical protein